MKKSLLLIVMIGGSLWTTAQEVTGLLGAFPPELALLQKSMESKSDTIIQNIHFIKGMLNGKAVVLAQTGIGKVNAAITTTLMIEHFNPHEILFSGIAGGIDSELAPGDIVIATRAAYHDYGSLTDTGMVYGPTRNAVSGQLNPLFFDCDSNLVTKALIAVGKLKLERVNREKGAEMPVVKKGTIVTGDTFVSSAVVTERLRNRLHAAATEMEGAAIAQTCYQQNIPFLIIRSLSDKANNKARGDMMHFYEIAARNAAMLVMGIVGEL
ncbi:MAG: Adenosylhomocysteine nucleosidase [Ferruginibacter sp.]|nr:Adenosylhomocysteine nucleosidase [Ferruginibacter sp.]